LNSVKILRLNDISEEYEEPTASNSLGYKSINEIEESIGKKREMPKIIWTFIIPNIVFSFNNITFFYFNAVNYSRKPLHNVVFKTFMRNYSTY
jgi:hypothetical protein